MLQTFVIGLGRAGAELHVSALSRVRRCASARRFFAEAPLAVCDPRFASSGDLEAVLRGWDGRGTVLIDSISQAARLLDPQRTVVHVCTPPTVRLEIIDQLARNGFRKILVEKPLALDEATLADIEWVRRHWSLHLVVVAQWLVSALTLRLRELMRSAALGELRSLSFLQCKPRFSRTLSTTGHPTAFDVELPHSVGVALRLAGPAQVSDAGCTDMVVGDLAFPRMGGARLTLEHERGVRTEIISDLTSPVRERRIELRFARGFAVGHYPGSRDDDYAQLSVVMDSGAFGVRLRTRSHGVFHDDALSAFLLRAYQRFGGADVDGSGVDETDFVLNAQAARLLWAAKRLPAGRDEDPPAGPAVHCLEPSGISGGPQL